ncbi:hypothetical protein FACS1894116_03660 [Betaproteobacteria bacterium]|nr:hypothetical protein FACS1894116_03660 [Betaproteobacteria bacterium]GHU25360.1 hypothetical protein FACS189488_12210 [Betaproteobacteria bacterium]GHU29212.1 hypothetical protein FACS189497_06730 [Betaproteobacteria bacterium]
MKTKQNIWADIADFMTDGVFGMGFVTCIFNFLFFLWLWIYHGFAIDNAILLSVVFGFVISSFVAMVFGCVCVYLGHRVESDVARHP